MAHTMPAVVKYSQLVIRPTAAAESYTVGVTRHRSSGRGAIRDQCEIGAKGIHRTCRRLRPDTSRLFCAPGNYVHDNRRTNKRRVWFHLCLLYTSDAADDLLC